MKRKRGMTLVELLAILFIIFIFIMIAVPAFSGGDDDDYDGDVIYNDETFSIIASSENKILDESLKRFAKKNHFDLNIKYLDTLDVIDELNIGNKYDAILIGNSIWLSLLDTNVVHTSSLRSTSITPVIFGIKESKAKSLGFTDKKVYTKDILDKINSGELKFSMANPVTTNSGASAYIEVLYNLAGSPEVLTEEHLQNENLKNNMKKFFEGIERTSGDEDFLEQSFLNGDYDAAFTYESSIININKELEKSGKETLYAVYPIDGVAISDSPFVYIDNKNEYKKEIFLKIQEYLLGSEGQDILLQNGRRTWYGGVNANAPKDVFNPKWGINTTEYITPVKYPSMAVIKSALALYQAEFRKPVHVVFCLDYSGSMYGDGIKELKDAMKYILTSDDLSVAFNDKDIVDVVPFGTSVLDYWSTSQGLTLDDLLTKIERQELSAATALYPASIKALEVLSDEDRNKYVSSVILMTDGYANVGSFEDLKKTYQTLNKDIPIYSITFGGASESELKQISDLTNGKVFDGKTNLLLAFKKVRGYN